MNTHQDLVMTLNQLKQEFTIQRRQLLLLQNNLKQIHTRTLSQTKVIYRILRRIRGRGK